MSEVMAEVVVMVGLPGCGKSTWIKDHLARTHVVVSKDLWPNAQRRDVRQRKAIDEALRDHLDVVVDNANLSPIERGPIIAAAHQHGARVRAVFIDTPLDECLARNATRQGRPAVPDVEIPHTRRRLVAPSLQEGFDEVETVAPSPAERPSQPTAPLAARSG